MINTRILAGIGIILVLGGLSRAEAQKTNMIVTISDKSFPERSDWGESVRISSMSFRVNGKPFGSVELGSTSATVLIAEEFVLEGAEIRPEIEITYIHHTWNLFGDKSTSYTIKYPLNTQTLDPYGNAEMKTYSDFYGLQMLVDWHFSYKVEITPFKPRITESCVRSLCYNASSGMDLYQDNAGFYVNPYLQYEWQYGIYTDLWTENNDFGIYIISIANLLYDNCPGSSDLSCEGVRNAILHTDYSYMNLHYDLYQEPALNDKYEIARLLLAGIMDQQQTLTITERNFLSFSFIDLVMTQDQFPPPFIRTESVTTWTTIGTSSATDGSIHFIPVNIVQPSPEKIRTAIRARAFFALKYGPYSEIHNVVILPGAPKFTLNATASCPNRPTGEIILSGVSGVFPLNDFLCIATKDGDEAGIHESFSGDSYKFNRALEGGKYTVSLTYDGENGGCSTDQHVIIGNNNQLSFSYNFRDASCPETADGEITVSVTEHHGDYSFRLNDQTFNNTGGSFRNLDNGTYRLVVSDYCYNGISSKEVTIPIAEPAAVYVEINGKSDPTCLSDPDGSVSVKTAGGNSIFDYQVLDSDGSVVYSITEQGSAWSCNSLSGGNYVIRARSGGCAWKTSGALNLAIVQQLSFTTEVTDVSCFGENTGRIILTASGGQAPYLYKMANQEFTGDNIFGNVAAGTYNVQVHTADMTCNDISSAEITVGTAPQIEIGLTAENASCFGYNDGEITAVVSGGTGPYQYSWELSDNNGSWFPEQYSSDVLKDLYAGRYRLNVTDSMDCTRTEEFAVTEPPLLVIDSVELHDVSCLGEEGSIEVSVSGGSGLYGYSCYNDQEFVHRGSGSVIGLPAGEYFVEVTDSEGCRAEYGRRVKITEPDSALDFMVSSPEYNGFNVACSGHASGRISIEVSGGNGSGYEGYQYFLSGASGQEENIFEDLLAGSYRIRVTDARGCSMQKPFTITEPGQLTLELLSSEPASCHGSPTGEIRVSAKGGIENTYKYTMKGMGIVSSGSFKNLIAGTYEVEVSDLNGCKKSISATVQSLNPPIDVSVLSLTEPFCPGDPAGKISIAATGGTQPYEYSINDGAYISSSEFTGLCAGRYSVKVRDNKGCTGALDTDIVSSISEMKITGSVSDVKCFGESSGSIDVIVEGGAKPFTFNWRDNISASLSASGLGKGEYVLYARDSAGCRYEKTFRVDQPDAPLNLTAISSPACAGLKNGLVTAIASGGTPPYRYAPDTRSDFSQISSFNVYAGNQNIYVTDANKCIHSTAVRVSEKNRMPQVNFMLATSRYELDTLVIIDVSNPAPDKVTWEFSPDALVIDTGLFRARVKYNRAGIFPVKMTGHFGSCAYIVEKFLNISAYDPYSINETKGRKGIKTIKIAPNPNDGRFELRIGLYSRQKVTAKVYDFQSRLLFDKTFTADTDFSREINLDESIMAGTYVLWVISEDDAKPAVFVISK